MKGYLKEIKYEIIGFFKEIKYEIISVWIFYSIYSILFSNFTPFHFIVIPFYLILTFSFLGVFISLFYNLFSKNPTTFTKTVKTSIRVIFVLLIITIITKLIK